MVLELGDDDDVAGAEVVETPHHATMFRAAVTLRVKITSRADGALISARTFSRAPS